MRGLSSALLIAAIGFGALTGCATTTYAGPRSHENRVGDAMQQPFRDVSWMREEPPEILKQAVLDPYRFNEDARCDDVLSVIGALDVLLGPDIDAYELTEDSVADAGALAVDAVTGFIGLPFRGVFRWMSGAGQREKVLADAILSGLARRSFLKGVARTTGCSQRPDSQRELE